MRIVLLATAGAAALLAAGCGGDDRLSREELASRADAICTKYEGELDQLAEPQSLADVERLAKEAKPVIEDGVDELDSLRPPEDLEDEWDRWISGQRESIEALDDLREAAAARDDDRIQQVVQEQQGKEQEADDLARELGLDECATG